MDQTLYEAEGQLRHWARVWADAPEPPDPYEVERRADERAFWRFWAAVVAFFGPVVLVTVLHIVVI
ncbi:MAG: hypothetical protein ABSA08_09305 [Acidimicrobiales bacterium]|jgi:hypothetical protein